jgi:hypothetical protein
MNLRLCFFLLLNFYLYFSLSIPLLAQDDFSRDDYQKGMTFYNIGKYEEALQHFKDVVNDDPNNWQGYQLQAYCDFYLDKRDDMIAAITESLKLHPDNQVLIAFLARAAQQNSAPSSQPTPSLDEVTQPAATPAIDTAKEQAAAETMTQIRGTLPSPTPAPDTAKEQAAAETMAQIRNTLPTPTPNVEALTKNSPVCLKLGGFGDFAALGQLNTSADNWNNDLSQTPLTGGATLSNLGFGFQTELAIDLNPQSALSLKANFSGGHGYQESAFYNGQSEDETIDPMLGTIGLEYYRYLPEKGGRFFFCAGAFYGEAIVPVTSDTPNYTLTGTLWGGNVGADLGLGNEFYLSANESIEIAARFQYLVVNQVQNSYTDNLGDSGQMTLARDSEGDVALADTRIFDQPGYNPAQLDYTGIILGISLNQKL